MNCQKSEEYHEAIVELVGYADKLIFCLKKKQCEYVHFTVVILAEGCFVDADEEPHSDYIDKCVNIAHVLFCDVVVCQVIKHTIDVKRGGRILDWACFTDQFGIVCSSVHINFGLLGIGMQIYLMEAIYGTNEQ